MKTLQTSYSKLLPSVSSSYSKVRLPKSVRPSQYHLTITPNLRDFSFHAAEKIKITIDKPTKELILHSVDLDINSVVWLTEKNELASSKIVYVKKTETVKFIFPKSIFGKGTLSIELNGKILEGLQGFYRSKYTHKNKEKFLATTQLEATDARRMFPCFDEPAHKAVFKISVIIPKQLQAISNTIESQVLPHHLDSGLKVVHFEPTPKMSTYLLALIVGELEHLHTQTKRGVKIRIHTTPGKKSQGKFALDVTKKVLEFLESYFGINYPLPVLDMIAIPDFAAAAMENWGAVTFREKDLLVDDLHTTFIGRQRVAEVIAHELVHQWFGNLVTMEWWTHLWLNESFATYMAYLTVDKLFPEWKFWTKFVLQEQSYALSQDSLQNSHPIEIEVHHPNEIGEIFDGISYAKGASVLRMLSSYIGEQAFQKGLTLYLKKHSYKNTSSIHLWEAFEKASGQPVRKFMKQWTTIMGYPVVSVDIDTKNNKLNLSQSHFTQLSVVSNKKINTKKIQTNWSIPLLPIYKGISDNKISSDSITLSKSKQTINLPQDYGFIKLNDSEQSFFIANYDHALLEKILPKIRNKSLSSVDRLAIYRNLFLLSKSGYVTTDTYLETLNHLDNEDSYIVWSEISTSLNQLEQLLFGAKAEKLLSNFKRQLFGNLINRKYLGYKEKLSEKNNYKTLRGLAFLESGLSNYKPSVDTAYKLFKSKLSGKNIDADIRLAVYCTIANNGNSKDYYNLRSIYTNSHLAQEKQQVLMAMTKFSNSNIQKILFKFLFSDEIRDQDRHIMINYCLQNPKLKHQTWLQIKKQWTFLEKKYGDNKMLGLIISGASSFNTPTELNEFEEFVKTHNLNSAKQITKQTREKIQIKLQWKSRDLAVIERFLRLCKIPNN